jgi:DNA-3-methyladenine glycosylase II
MDSMATKRTLTPARHKARLARHLASLLALDPRLQAVHHVAGEVLPRSRAPGFEGLARIICGQQVSVASADAIWSRLEARDGLQGVGLSRSKYLSITAVAQAIVTGDLDLDAVAALPAEDAIASLTGHRGVGPWTAEIYLMFCAGHPDIFPSGDLALQKAVGEAFGIAPCPDRRALAAMAESWAPYRAAAALLFWRFYAATRQRDALPV